MNIDNGTGHGEVENWAPGAKNRDDVLCDNSGHGSRSIGGARCFGSFGSLWGKAVAIGWQVQHKGKDVATN